MKFILSYFLCLLTFVAHTIEFTRETSGFSTTDSFLYNDNKVINYKNNTTWKDSLGNYGISKCLGLIVSNISNNIIDYKMYCKYVDQDNEEFTHQYKRETEYQGGVGKSILIDGVGKWKDKLGIECTYAIDYLKEALFIMEKCNNK